jgi:hypothetical protein
LLFFFAATFVTCKKETIPEVKISTPIITSDTQSRISVSDAQSLFLNGNGGAIDRDFEGMKGVVPMWDAATKSLFAGKTEILIVPVEPEKKKPFGSGANLIFFTNGENTLDYKLMVHVPTENYRKAKGLKLDVKDFCGTIMTIKPKEKNWNIVMFENGTAFGNDNGGVVAYEGIFCTGPGDCYDFGDSFWDNIIDFFDGNCTTIPVLVLNNAGLGIPLTPRNQWLIGVIKGNPGDLGEDLRDDPHGGVFTSHTTLQNFTPATCQ